MIELNNQVAIVTGGARGIGRAIALKLAKRHATVIINYNHSDKAAIELKNIIESDGGKAAIYPCDVANHDAFMTFVKTVLKDFKRIDILVNNAGIVKDDLIMRLSEAQFDSVIDVNLKGTFNGMKAVSRTMLKQRQGRIINISSISGLHGNPGQANYAAAKAGIIGLTKTAAKELASRHITVNAIAPGFIDTDMTAALSDHVREDAAKAIPLARLGTGEDIANIVAFLASDEASYITGQVITVDGGMTI